MTLFRYMVASLLLVSISPVTASPAEEVPGSASSPVEQRIIPLSYVLGLHDSGTLGLSAGSPQTNTSRGAIGEPGCQALVELQLGDEHLGFHADADSGFTDIFCGVPLKHKMIHVRLYADLSYDVDTLPIDYGGVWAVEDLDRDGAVELVIQRGDAGFGGDGYLDIHSYPSWNQRAHFTMPGMKVEMFAEAVNVDADDQIEIFLTPETLGGSGRLQIIDYDTLSGEFFRLIDEAAFPYTGGPAAIADFDNDQRVEFIVGASPGYDTTTYALYELSASELHYTGLIGSTYLAATNYASAVMPLPDGQVHALLGRSNGDSGFVYELLRPVADNEFEFVRDFREVTSWAGVPPSGGADADCDGLDELVMSFYPVARLWEWDPTSNDFVPGCEWDQQALGTFTRFYRTDLDIDGVGELTTADHESVLRAFEFECITCLCPFASDFDENSILNSVDLNKLINALFFNGPNPQYPLCPTTKADFDFNGPINTVDLNLMINYLFFNGDGPCDPCNPVQETCAP